VYLQPICKIDDASLQVRVLLLSVLMNAVPRLSSNSNHDMARGLVAMNASNIKTEISDQDTAPFEFPLVSICRKEAASSGE
jgi:hypothetical protein